MPDKTYTRISNAYTKLLGAEKLLLQAVADMQREESEGEDDSEELSTNVRLLRFVIDELGSWLF